MQILMAHLFFVSKLWYFWFQDILSRTKANQSLNWYKSLEEYYFRQEWELYDLKVDAEEKYNVAQKESYQVKLRKFDIIFDINTFIVYYIKVSYIH